jgi:protein-tyrosine-phosphatase
VIREGSNREGQKIIDKDMNIVNVMKEVGIDVSNSVRNQLTPEMFAKADKVIVIVPSENIPEYVKHNNKVIFWEVPDPFNRSLEFAREVRNQLQTMIKNFIETSQELKLNTRINLH